MTSATTHSCYTPLGIERPKSPAGAHAVVGKMQQHLDSYEIQARGCVSLALLADGNPDQQTEVAAVGGIQMVLEALRRDPDNAKLQSKGCWDLGPKSVRGFDRPIT